MVLPHVYVLKIYCLVSSAFYFYMLIISHTFMWISVTFFTPKIIFCISSMLTLWFIHFQNCVIYNYMNLWWFTYLVSHQYSFELFWYLSISNHSSTDIFIYTFWYAYRNNSLWYIPWNKIAECSVGITSTMLNNSKMIPTGCTNLHPHHYFISSDSTICFSIFEIVNLLSFYQYHGHEILFFFCLNY